MTHGPNDAEAPRGEHQSNEQGWAKPKAAKQVRITRLSHSAALPATLALQAGEERESNLVRSVLDMVPVGLVLDLVGDYVRKANRAQEMRRALTLRGDLAKPRIEERSGFSWSTEEVGKKLRKDAETIRNYIDHGKLVGYRAASDRTRWRLPMWQFRVEDNGYAVHDWVSDLVAALGANGWGVLDFVTVPRTHLAGSNYLHLLQNGRADEVVAAAKRSTPD